MTGPQRDVMISRLFFNAAFPVMRVPLNDDPGFKKKFASVKARVQVQAVVPPETLPYAGNGMLGCILSFDHGEFSRQEGFCENPDLLLHFDSIAKMNDMFSGGSSLPSIGKLLAGGKIGLLVKVLSLLMSLKLMMPSNRPRDPLKRYLKVKMSLYMITTALSLYNKYGDESMQAWTSSQPDRIYQFSVEPYEPERGIAAYLRVKAGKTKAGRGIYERRKPFVHFRFNGVDGALKVLLKEVEFVESVEKGYILIEGSPEYAAQLNDIMGILQGMLTK